MLDHECRNDPLTQRKQDSVIHGVPGHSNHLEYQGSEKVSNLLSLATVSVTMVTSTVKVKKYLQLY